MHYKLANLLLKLLYCTPAPLPPQSIKRECILFAKFLNSNPSSPGEEVPGDPLRDAGFLRERGRGKLGLDVVHDLLHGVDRLVAVDDGGLKRRFFLGFF